MPVGTERVSVLEPDRASLRLAKSGTVGQPTDSKWETSLGQRGAWILTKPAGDVARWLHKKGQRVVHVPGKCNRGDL